MATPIQVNQLATQTLIKRVDTTSSFTYVGESVLGSTESNSSWRIKRVSVIDGDAVILWAGTGDFNQIWINRLTLTYG